MSESSSSDSDFSMPRLVGGLLIILIASIGLWLFKKRSA